MANNVDWRTLEAGRELNKLIAEMVGDKVILHYSTDLNAWNNHVYVLWWSAGKWGASFDFDPPYDTLAKDEIYARQIENAETPALAVCRAFLGWKEARE